MLKVFNTAGHSLSLRERVGERGNELAIIIGCLPSILPFSQREKGPSVQDLRALHGERFSN